MLVLGLKLQDYRNYYHFRLSFLIGLYRRLFPLLISLVIEYHQKYKPYRQLVLVSHLLIDEALKFLYCIFCRF